MEQNLLQTFVPKLVPKVLCQELISHFGIPAEIVIDQGTQFKSIISAELDKILASKKQKTQ